MRRAVPYAGLALVAVGAAVSPGLSSCNQDNPGLDRPAIAPPPPGPHIAVNVEADKATHYQALCDVRTYQSAPGQLANRYGLDKTGPFKDVILSPNAHCTIELIRGPSVKVTLTKIDFPAGRSATDKDTSTTTVTTPGDAGKFTLHLW